MENSFCNFIELRKSPNYKSIENLKIIIGDGVLFSLD